MSGPFRVGVLVSGHGTNLEAILRTVHGSEGIEVACVGSNRSDAPALLRAEAAEIDTAAFPLAEFADRAARDGAMSLWLSSYGISLVVLAGYMELVSPQFLRSFEGAVINVHPSLLPAFPGLRAVEQAYEYGVKVFGVTVHYVDEGVDTGPVILQRAIELREPRDPAEVLDRLRALEYALLPEAIRLIARGALTFDPDAPRRVRIRE